LLVFVPDDEGHHSSGTSIALWVATAWAFRFAAGIASVATHSVLLALLAWGSPRPPPRSEEREKQSPPSRTGGPLGPGGAKIWEALAGATWVVRSGLGKVRHVSLKSSQLDVDHHPYHEYLTWGKPVHEQPAKVWLGLALLCLTVNLVLSGWSSVHMRQDKPLQHEGVATMVRSSVGRTLRLREHLRLLYWAVANAICEEVTSRAVWRIYFESLLLRSVAGTSPTGDYEHARNGMRLYSNLCQAAVFGMWHYHGIPSGTVGVGLSFVYGLVMGGLADYNRGLGLAVIAHSVADYYIFAAIARKQLHHEQQLARKGR
jgi:Type II CAAX prenyl endopeptidase Rce1-like